MTHTRWDRYAPLLGALFVILVAVGFVIAGETPGTDSLPAEIKHDYDDQAKHLIGLYLVILGAVALLFFGAYLRSVLRRLDAPGRMANAAFAGAITAAVGFMVAAGLHGAITDAADQEEVSGAALQALNALDNWSWVPFTAGIAVLVFSTGAATVRRGRGIVPTWFAWLGLVIGFLGITPLGFFAFLAAGLWLITLSVMLYVRGDTLHSEGSPPTNPLAT